jgi:hypothetical protein
MKIFHKFLILFNLERKIRIFLKKQKKLMFCIEFLD